MKDQIDFIISLWEGENPEDAKNFDLQMEDLIKEQLTDTASGKHMRYALELPEDLHRLITLEYPNIFSTRESVRWFMKEYPRFRISKLI